MPQISAGYSARPFQINMSQSLMNQTPDDNTSRVRTRIWITKNAYSPSWSNGSSSWSATVNGVTRTGLFTYDFRNSDSLDLITYDQTITHNADGTKSYPYSIGSTADGLGTASAQGTAVLTTISRPTQPSLSDTAVWFGDRTTVSMPRASSNFTHTVFMVFGNERYTFENKYDGTSLSVQPPMSLMEEIPTAVKGSGSIGVHTWNGNTLVGTKYTPITMQIPADIVPAFTNLALSEGTASIAAAGLSGYIQNVTKLNWSMNGVAGTYGSAIRSYRITGAGVTSTGRSGTTGTLTRSGVQAITATVTDSRGRTKTITQNITVQAYSPPKLTSVSVQRADASGVVSPTDGEFARVNLNVSVSSLKPGTTELNTLTYKVLRRVKGTTTWTTALSATPSGISFNAFVLASGVLVTNAYDIQVQIVDKLTTSVVSFTLGAATIFMHWDGQNGVGIGKFRQNGALDVAGDIYHRNGTVVEPTGLVIAYAGTTSPAGWLFCNGGTVSRTTYAALFAVIGTTFGPGNGSTTFTLPDLRARTIFGYQSGDIDFSPVGVQGGAKSHAHSLSADGYAKIALASNLIRSRRIDVDGWVESVSASGVTTSSTAGSIGTGSALGGKTDQQFTAPPFIALNFLIKV